MWSVPLLLLAITLGAPAAVGAPPSSVATCAGGETLAPLATRWAAAVHARAPNLTIAIDRRAKLAADGFTDLLAGRADCALFVREPFPSEVQAYRARFGHDPILAPVAVGSFATRGGTHAIAIYVNAANPIAGLTLAQLDAIFSAERRRGGGAVETWGDLGLGGVWAHRPIHRYGMLTKRESGNPPGVVNFVQQAVLKGGGFRDDVVQLSDTPGEQALAAIVRRVGEDPGGVGYSGFGYAQGAVRPLPVAEAGDTPFVAGTPASVAERRYPLSRRVYLMIRAPAAPAVAALVDEALSAEGQAMVASDAEGFLPLPPRDLADARQWRP